MSGSTRNRVVLVVDFSCCGILPGLNSIFLERICTQSMGWFRELLAATRGCMVQKVEREAVKEADKLAGFMKRLDRGERDMYFIWTPPWEFCKVFEKLSWILVALLCCLAETGFAVLEPTKQGKQGCVGWNMSAPLHC